MKSTKKRSAAKKEGSAKKQAGENKSRPKKITAPPPVSAPAPVTVAGGPDPKLACPICAGKISVRVAFSNIYCGYHLVPSCPGKCEWPNEYRYDLMRQITELHYEHPELFKTDEELTAESLAALKRRQGL
ncbi:MAG: hypothetical protein NT056_00755 [Proteobacteria bacterium]|nr:hypothetical protein [Pseudomonadota bacterium]